jgi:hypothetical protein
MAGALVLAACGKSGKAGAPTRPPGTVDFSDLQKAFPAPTLEREAADSSFAFRSSVFGLLSGFGLRAFGFQ